MSDKYLHPKHFHTVALTLCCLIPIMLAVTRAGADIAISLIGILFLVHSFLQKDWQWLKRPEIIALFLLWFYVMLNAFVLADTKYMLRSIVWGRFIFLFAAVTSWVLLSPKSLKAVATATIIAAFILLIDTYWQYITGTSLSGHGIPHENRLGGPMSHPNIGNLLLKTCLPAIAIAWYCYAKAMDKKKLLAVCLLGLLLVGLIPITGERSIMLLMLLAIAIVGGGLVVLNKEHRWKIILALLLCFVLFAVLITTQPVFHFRMTYLLEQLGRFSETSYGQLFTASYEMAKENPLMGVGVGKFQYVCPPLAEKLSLTFCDIHPHNTYLHWLSETGLIGIGIYITAMFLISKKFIASLSFKGEHLVPAIFALATISVLLWPAIVTQSVFSNWPSMLFWFTLSLAFCTPRISKAS